MIDGNNIGNQGTAIVKYNFLSGTSRILGIREDGWTLKALPVDVATVDFKDKDRGGQKLLAIRELRYAVSPDGKTKTFEDESVAVIPGFLKQSSFENGTPVQHVEPFPDSATKEAATTAVREAMGCWDSFRVE